MTRPRRLLRSAGIARALAKLSAAWRPPPHMKTPSGDDAGREKLLQAKLDVKNSKLPAIRKRGAR